MDATTRLAQRLVRTALKLHARRLWLEWDEEDAVVLDIPRCEEPAAACIMGQSGEEFGISLFRDGLAGMDRMFSGDGSEHEFETLDQISLLVSPLHEVPPPLRGLLEEARWRGRRDALAPHMIVKRPGKHARAPRKAEIRTMLFAVSAILAADAADDLEGRWYRAPEGVQLLRLSGAPHKPEYELDGTAFEPASPRTGELSVPQELAAGDYRVFDGVWSVGLTTTGAGIKGDDRTVSVLLIADAENGRVIHHDLVMGHDLDQAALSLLGKFELDREMPRELLVLNRGLAERIEPALSPHEIDCRHEPDQPLLTELAAGLARSLEYDEDDAGPGAPGDARSNQHRLAEAMAEVASRIRTRPDRAVKRYFGSMERADELVEGSADPEQWLVPFTTWHFALYRARRGAKTILERTLTRRDLAPEVRAVGEAMRDANPSIFRIERLEPPFVDLFDLVTGAQVRVFDETMSRTGYAGVVVPALVYRADGIDSISMIGPALPPQWGSRAFDVLDSLGIECTPEGLAKNPHFGGRLAEQAESAPPFTPELCNSEGHVLLEHVGDFAADDPRAAAQALDAHPDFDFDADNGEYVWLREGQGFGGGDLVLGRVEPIGDNFVLECNSAERFAEGRKLLESIPGLRFEGVRTRAFDPSGANDDTPADDLPGIREHRGDGLREGELDQNNLPPEIVEQLVAHLTRFQMEWLDSEIPMFGGKTPRAMCKTKKGRDRIRIEIRSMPAPHPALAGEHMDRIRALMFHELNLEPDG